MKQISLKRERAIALADRKNVVKLEAILEKLMACAPDCDRACVPCFQEAKRRYEKYCSIPF